MRPARLLGALAALAALAGCERDPDLHGYWDITELRVGSTDDDAVSESLAGSMEFTREATVYAVWSYTWTGSLQPDPTPDTVVYSWQMTSSDPSDEFGYVTPDETYTVTLTGGGAVPDVYAVEDWKGSSVTLRSELAAPPPAAADTPPMFVELSLER